MAIVKSLQIKGSVDLTNRMWFGVVCTLIDDHMRQHGDQNVVTLDSLYRQRQISQSDCKISSNCGKNMD